nr:leucine-rich repeat domain-containing protein [uncultured Capnocytophaga sp.]
MKNISIIVILLFTISLFTQCKKDDPIQPLNDFSLSQNSVSLTKDSQQKITITSGNGEYTLTQSEESKKVAQTSISSDKKEIVIKAITEGKISVEITDVLAKKSASLEISVLSKVTPQDYELSQDKKTLIKWKGAHTKSLDMNIIEALKGVTNIGEEAFSGNKNIELVVLPKALTSIADQVFMDCSNLKSVSIPDTVTSIGRGAFGDCTKLAEVQLPKGLTEIPNTFFYGCKSLAKITIPEGVQSVGFNAFEQTLIKEIIFPAALKTLDTDVVAWCEKLEKIVFKGSTPPTIDYSSLKRKVENPPLKIYVPKGKKQTYIDSSEEWKDLEELIVENNS